MAYLRREAERTAAMNGRRCLTLVTAAGLLVSCTRQTTPASPTATSSPLDASPEVATPAPIATAGAMLGSPVDVATLTGRIVFSGGTDDVWMVNADGSGLIQLTANTAQDFDPSVSSDGRRIAFRSDRDGNNEIYVMEMDGSHQHDVSRDDADDWGPAWSPDGRVVWNCARHVPVGFRACVANTVGDDLRILPIDRYVEYPAWSPDGSRIAFMSQQPGASGNDPNYDIFVVNVDGSGLRQLTDAPGEEGFPSWSPDGTRIAFSSTRDDCSNSDGPDCRTTGDVGPYQTIYVMNADGADQHRLSLQLGMFVDWSPDGRYVVFSPGLNVIRPDGSGLTTIQTGASAAEAEFADWGR
jgi:TolB protein